MLSSPFDCAGVVFSPPLPSVNILLRYKPKFCTESSFAETLKQYIE